VDITYRGAYGRDGHNGFSIVTQGDLASSWWDR
jgi:hypothetical protein